MHRLSQTTVTAVLITLSTLVALTMPSAATEPDRAEVVVGDVTVKQVSGLGLSVIVDRFDASERDHSAENIYALQMNEPPAMSLPIHLEGAEVVFKQDHLVVVSLEEPWALALVLSDVDRDRRHRIQEHITRLGRTGTTHFEEGYGLVRHSGRFPVELDHWPPSGEESRVFGKSSSGDVTAQGGCTSGGPGSSSAEIECINGISSAGVTCRAGYYACCNCTWYGEAECNCVEDGSAGGGDCDETLPHCGAFDDI